MLVGVVLGYFLTDKQLMFRVLRELSFFNDEKKLKVAVEILVGIITVIFFLTNGLMAAVRFLFTVICFVSTRTKLATAPIPKALKGEPITLLTAVIILVVLYGLR